MNRRGWISRTARRHQLAVAVAMWCAYAIASVWFAWAFMDALARWAGAH